MNEKQHDKLKQIQEAIQAFNSDKLYHSSIALFKALDYTSNKTDRITPNNFDGFMAGFGIPKSIINPEKALASHWKQIEFVFQLDTAGMKQHETLFQETVNRNEPASYLFFSIELTENDYSRNQLSQIAREINKPFPMNVFVLFRYGNFLTLSLIDKRQNKKILHKDVVEKITHLYKINIQKPHAAHLRILRSFSFESIVSEAPKKRVTSFAELHNGWRKVISTDILNKQFYLDYSQLSVKLIQAIYPGQIQNKLIAHQGILNLLNRIMFIYFVQKKEWIMKDENFILHFWRAYKASGEKDTFHENWLNSIFFSAFNGIALRGPKAFKALPEPYKTEIISFPYLNGGLFAKNDEYDNFILSDSYFTVIFTFFESYIFTITEDTPYDVNLEISPELLGKMYEGMINATDLDDVDAENGIIYTERPEINFMTRRSFVEVLDRKLKGALSREFLYHFVFDEPEQKPEILKRYKVNTKTLRQAIVTITSCDPACGSGSIILGVIQLQMELLRVLDAFDGNTHSPKDDFLIKKQLISECIYGVDIKEWAVRIAELRLWLYMIAEAEFTKEELTKTPLLPNLDFKLRKGNSLLQKFGSLDFTLEELLKGRSKSAGAARKLNEFVKKKKAFILNQEESNTTYKKLKAEEFSVFIQFIDELIIEKDIRLKNLGKQGKQMSFLPEPEQVEADLFAEEKEELRREIERLKQLKASMHKEKRLPFSYDIDFMEVFLTNDDPGFDLIIGNPPYVRQEQILPPDDGEYLEYLLLPENKDEKAKVNKEYKEQLNAKVYKTYPFLSTTVKTQIEGKNKTIPVYGTKVPGRSDLYCYFQLLCPDYLNSNGTFCFIISNSWLDVDFGGFIQQFLLKHTQLYGVYDCNVRSFDAAVNTIIYLHSAITNIPKQLSGAKGKYKLVQPIENTVKFVMNKIDFTNAAYAPLLLEQEHCHKNTFRDLYRVISLSQAELYAAGYDDEQFHFTGDKWGGKYLRAPEIYYTILQKGKDKLVKLGEIAEVRFGIKTGANDFFILDNETLSKWEIEDEFLVPIIKSPKECDQIETNSTLLPNKLIYCHKDKSDLKGTKILKYIQWGEESEVINGIENRAYNLRPSTKGRAKWWDVGLWTHADALWMEFIYEVNRVYLNSAKVLESDKFYGLTFKKPIDSNICLNNSIVSLQRELLGFSSLGEGALKLPVYEVKNILIVNPIVAVDVKIERKVLSVFNELGFDKSMTIRDQQPNPLPDRKALDDIIFDELGLTSEERNEVYWSVAELVKQRLDKAASR
jgi:hypothetical protein